MGTWAHQPMYSFAIIFLLCIISFSNAKKSTGSFVIDQHAPFEFITKFGYRPGDGKYKVRAKASKPQVGDTPKDIRLVIFIDTQWAEISKIDDCARPARARATKNINLQPKGKWSDYQSGVLSQRVRPYVWYFAFDTCDEKNKLEHGTRIKWEAEFKQENGSHFSVEQYGSFTATGIELLIYVLFLAWYLRSVIQHKKDNTKIHPMLVALNVAIGFQVVALACRFVHHWLFSVNGIGLKPLDVVAQLFMMLSQVTVTSVLLVIALGYTLLHAKLAKLEHTTPMVVLTMVVVHVMLVVLSKIKDESSDKFHETEGFAGWMIVGVRLIIFAWFLLCARRTLEKASLKQQVFLRKLVIAASGYFLAYPLVHVLSSLVLASYVRHHVVSVVLCIVQMASIGGLSTLFLTKSEYFQVSTFSATFLPSVGTLISMGSRGSLD